MFMYSLILSDAYIMAISSCRGGCPSPSSKVGLSLHSLAYSKICAHGSSEQPEKDFGSFCNILFDMSYTGSLITNPSYVDTFKSMMILLSHNMKVLWYLIKNLIRQWIISIFRKFWDFYGVFYQITIVVFHNERTLAGKPSRKLIFRDHFAPSLPE